MGYLSINHEATPGGVAVLDINFDTMEETLECERLSSTGL